MIPLTSRIIDSAARDLLALGRALCFCVRVRDRELQAFTVGGRGFDGPSTREAPGTLPTWVRSLCV